MFDKNIGETKQAKLYCSMIVKIVFAICVAAVAVLQNNINVLWWWLLVLAVGYEYTTENRKENRKRGKPDGQIED